MRETTSRTAKNANSPTSLPFIEVPLDLKTLPAGKTFVRYFKGVEQSLYLASTIALIVAHQKNLGTESLETALADVDIVLEEEKQALETSIARWERQLANVKGLPDVLYTHTRSDLARFRTSQAGVYLALIQSLDRAGQLIHRAFFARRMDALKKLNEERGLERRMSRLAGQINGNIRREIKTILNDNGLPDRPEHREETLHPADHPAEVAMVEPDDLEGRQLEAAVQKRLALVTAEGDD